jgi:hypothetical protein
MMAQAKTPQQPQDPYAQRGKTLTSLVQRLRGWVGSDPSKDPELADALVQLTAHRLLGHGYAAAAADAQESVRRAADLLAATGPIGPYTSITDAARYVAAVVHLATVQAGMGMPDTAGRTIESLQGIQDQLGDELLKQLEPQSAIWALSCCARAQLVPGNVAEANAYADAALARVAESGLRDGPDAQYLAMDVERLASDCRWAAGRSDEAIAYLHAAKVRYDDVAAGRLKEPARLSPALLERLAEPLFGVYRDTADRLVATSEVDLGLGTRRALIELLHGLTGRLGDPIRLQLASALTDLGHDLVRAGRIDEAAAASAEAAAVMQAIERSQAAVQDVAGERIGRGTQPVTWAPLPRRASYAATTAAGAGSIDSVAHQAELLQRSAAWLQSGRPEAQRLELQRAEHARTDAQRREAERVEADRGAAAQREAERAQAEQAERVEAQRQAAAERLERLERKRRREERIEAHRLEAEQRAAEQRAAERLEAERRELERLQAQIDELERAEKRAHEQ